jgi:hypothetical protein
MKHSPTPWITGPSGKSIISSLNQLIARCKNESDAKRIVACVNAFDGIENPEQWVAMAKTHIAASEAQAKQSKRLENQLEQLGKIAHAIANHVRPLEEQVKMKRTINAILGNNAGGGK